MSNENPDEKYPITAYEQWSKEPHKRWINAGNTFGAHLMSHVRDNAIKNIPSNASTECREVAEQSIENTICHMMALLDGIFKNRIDQSTEIIYSLLAHVEDGSDSVLETFELAPNGDSLGMGYEGWRNGDFGQE